VINEAAIRRRFETLGPYLDERQRWVFATSEALAAGWGGIAAVSRITGIARSTIGRGVSLRRRPPFPGRLDERRWVIVVGVVMGSVHKLGYGHKFEGSAAASVVA
jgi:hypothetical protein